MTLGQGLYGLPEPPAPPRQPSRWRWLWRIVLSFAGVVTVSLTTLHFAGGNSDELKKTLEQYLSESSGYRVTIGRLNAVSFYPLIGVDMDNVFYVSPDGARMATLEHVNFSASFWSVASGSGLHSLDLRGIAVEPGVLVPGKIEIDRMDIDAGDLQHPRLRLAGRYRDQSLAAAVELQPHRGVTGSVFFGIATPAAFTLNAGPLTAAGVLRDTESERQFHIDALRTGPQARTVTGDLAFLLETDKVNLHGKADNGRSALTYDLNISRGTVLRRIGGTIIADRLDAEDLGEGPGLRADLAALRALWGGTCRTKAMVAVDGKVKPLQQNGAVLPGQDSKISMSEDERIQLTPPLSGVAAFPLCAETAK